MYRGDPVVASQAYFLANGRHTSLNESTQPGSVGGVPPRPSRPSPRLIPRGSSSIAMYLQSIRDIADAAPTQPPSATLLHRAKENQKRKLQREYEGPYLKEMKTAHSEQQTAKPHIPSTPTGEVVGLKTVWHRAVRSLARRFLDYSIRTYKTRADQWRWAVFTISLQLEDMFSYDHPITEKYLSKYIKETISGDRKKWKKYFVDTGMQHHKMPNEAWASWKSYWVSQAGIDEAEHMKEIHLLRGTSNRKKVVEDISTGGRSDVHTPNSCNDALISRGSFFQVCQYEICQLLIHSTFLFNHV